MTITFPLMQEKRHLYIETYGCQMNVADSEVVASVMETAGYSMTDSLENADAILLNTCSIRDNAEQKIISRLAFLNSPPQEGQKKSADNRCDRLHG